MTYTNIILTKHICKRCGHEWFSRLNRKPVCCPKCKSYFYDQERKEEGKDHDL